MTEKKINILEKLEEGYVHVRAIVEMMGRPKEHVLETLKSYITKLDEADHYIVVNEDYSDAEEKDDMFSIFVEIELLIKGTEQIAWFCFDYLPSSIEIIDPESLKYKSPDLTNFMNDLLGRLHHLDMSFKTDRAKIDKLNTNSEALMKNFLGYIIDKKSKNIEELSEIMGIPEKQMELLLNRLIGEKYIQKSEDKYSLVASK